jgi:hypothetical protein
LSIGAAGDRRRAANTGDVGDKLVDTSYVGDVDACAGREAFGMNGRRNAALREHVVADAAAGRNELARAAAARTAIISARHEKRQHAHRKQRLAPRPASPKHDAGVLPFRGARNARNASHGQSSRRATLAVNVGARIGLSWFAKVIYAPDSRQELSRPTRIAMLPVAISPALDGDDPHMPTHVWVIGNDGFR